MMRRPQSSAANTLISREITNSYDDQPTRPVACTALAPQIQTKGQRLLQSLKLLSETWAKCNTRPRAIWTPICRWNIVGVLLCTEQRWSPWL